MFYGQRLAEGFEMINGYTECNIRPDCLRAPRETEVLGMLHDRDDGDGFENGEMGFAWEI